MRPQPRSFQRRQRKDPWTLWLLLALGLHWLAFELVHPQKSRASRSSTPQASAAVEVDVHFDEPPADVGPSANPPAATVALSKLAPRSSAPRAPGTPSGIAPRVARPSDAEVRAPEPAQAGDVPTEPEVAPSLSLDALGVGAHNPFIKSELARARPAAPTAPPRKSRRSRFQQNLANEILLADHSRNLGPAGPVLTELERATRTGEAAVNSSALFRCTTDADGKLVSIELSESSSDPAPFRRIARRVLASLGSKALRIPKTGQGVTFLVRVISHEELPSGADPGLAVNVLGMPVKDGQGPRSARIEILNLAPKLSTTKVQMPSGQTLEVPTLSIGSLLAAAVDPADIGSPAQRMVRSHVENLSVNDDQASVKR